jgi:hypothetical protein
MREKVKRINSREVVEKPMLNCFLILSFALDKVQPLRKKEADQERITVASGCLREHNPVQTLQEVMSMDLTKRTVTEKNRKL